MNFARRSMVCFGLCCALAALPSPISGQPASTNSPATNATPTPTANTNAAATNSAAAPASMTNAVATNAAIASVPQSNSVVGRQVQLLKEQFQAHQEYLTFRLNKVPWLQKHEILGQPLWRYLALLIYVVLAFSVAWFLDYTANAWLKRWSKRSGTRFNELLTELLKGPVRVVAFVIFLNIGLSLFDWGPAPRVHLAKVFIVIVAATLTYVSLKFVDLAIGVWLQRTSGEANDAFDEQLCSSIRKVIKIFVVIVAILVTADCLEIKITAALASLSVGALAVGLAAQDTLSNLFGAIAVYMDKPFRVGDQIRIDPAEGIVERIGLRSTRLRNADGHRITIPNRTVGNSMIMNITRNMQIKTEINLILSRDLSSDRVRRAMQILDELFRSNPKTANLVINFNKFTDAGMNIVIVHWWNDSNGQAQSAAMQEWNLKIKERFDAEGITLAMPWQTVLVKQ